MSVPVSAVIARSWPDLAFLARSESPDSESTVLVIAIVIGILVLLGLVWFISKFIRLWIQAYMSKAGITLVDLVGMFFRKSDMALLVQSKVNLVQADLRQIKIRDLEAHYLAGGNVINVTRAVIAADRADLPMDWNMAAGIDLAGRHVFEAVQTSVNPRVIDAPAAQSGKLTIDAVAKDGIQLKAKARVTVRTNLARLVGGATEETIIARVGEGIVSAIGSSDTYEVVLENPDKISKQVLSRGLDAGTAYEILSIDIADVDVGKNIGAELKAAQAEADVRVARALAEKRAALARAEEQEMQARTQKNQAEVVLAEAEIPRAIAQAFREGNLGLMEYFQLKNVQADTDMRSSISDAAKPEN